MSQACTILHSFSCHPTLLSGESKLCILAASKALTVLLLRCPNSRTLSAPLSHLGHGAVSCSVHTQQRRGFPGTHYRSAKAAAQSLRSQGRNAGNLASAFGGIHRESPSCHSSSLLLSVSAGPAPRRAGHRTGPASPTRSVLARLSARAKSEGLAHKEPLSNPVAACLPAGGT